MTGSRLSGANFRQPRRWSFADCVFDEANWTLSVGGRRVSIETKPLELLRVLLLHAGELVSKPELLDAIWPDVAVVEASLPTAAGKLRRALDDDRRDPHIVETVPRIGYRLAVEVAVEDISEAANPAITAIVAVAADRPEKLLARIGPRAKRPRYLPAIAGGLTIVIAAAAYALTPAARPAATSVVHAAGPQREQLTALRKLDLPAVERMLAAGWNPNVPYDEDGNGAINMALNNCEWDGDHDQRTMMLLVRTLIDGGAELQRHNRWGDTAYSIAKAKRYCGPNHPVTKMLRAMCYAHGPEIGDRCLATYELKRRSGRSRTTTSHG